jgi:hypothetical protein
MMLAFGDTVRLAGTHYDQAEISGQGAIVSVDGVEREIIRESKFDDFCARSREFMAESIVLGLSHLEVGRVAKAEITPSCGVLGPIPPGGAR